MEVKESEQQPRVAVVVGSGGAKCAAALGLWRVLKREGIEISMAVGSSGGSVYAAFMALGYDDEVAEKWTQDRWTPELMKGYTTNLRAAMSGKPRFTERSGLIDDGPVRARLHQAFGDRTFADAHFPLYIVSTDMHSGQPFVHSTGRVVEAIRASIAIPMIFPPEQIGDRFLVDGAVSDPLPVDAAIKEGADIVLAMGFELSTRSRLRSYLAVTAHFNSIYMNNILKSTFAFSSLAHHAEVIPILPQFERAIGTFDGDQIPHIIEAGTRATEEQVPYIRRLLLQDS
jgi:NTE family protein